MKFEFKNKLVNFITEMEGEGDLARLKGGLCQFLDVNWDGCIVGTLQDAKQEIESIGDAIEDLLRDRSEEWKVTRHHEINELRRIYSLVLESVEKAIIDTYLQDSNEAQGETSNGNAESQLVSQNTTAGHQCDLLKNSNVPLEIAQGRREGILQISGEPHQVIETADNSKGMDYELLDYEHIIEEKISEEIKTSDSDAKAAEMQQINQTNKIGIDYAKLAYDAVIDNQHSPVQSAVLGSETNSLEDLGTGAESLTVQRERTANLNVIASPSTAPPKAESVRPNLLVQPKRNTQRKLPIHYGEFRKLIVQLFQTPKQMNGSSTEIRRLNQAVLLFSKEATKLGFVDESVDNLVIAASTQMFRAAMNVLWINEMHKSLPTVKTLSEFLWQQEDMALSGLQLPNVQESMARKPISMRLGNNGPSQTVVNTVQNPFALRPVSEQASSTRNATIASLTVGQRAAFASQQKQASAIQQGKGVKKQKASNTNKFCLFCEATTHYAFECSGFQALDVTQRLAAVIATSFCANCLMGRHSVDQCQQGVCRNCQVRHNSWLCVARARH